MGKELTKNFPGGHDFKNVTEDELAVEIAVRRLHRTVAALGLRYLHQRIWRMLMLSLLLDGLSGITRASSCER